jgi:hypothetical protein
MYGPEAAWRLPSTRLLPLWNNLLRETVRSSSAYAASGTCNRLRLLAGEEIPTLDEPIDQHDDRDDEQYVYEYSADTQDEP